MLHYPLANGPSESRVGREYVAPEGGWGHKQTRAGARRRKLEAKTEIRKYGGGAGGGRGRRAVGPRGADFRAAHWRFSRRASGRLFGFGNLNHLTCYFVPGVAGVFVY